jgi:FAD/FMN-containing dehydrogenase
MKSRREFVSRGLIGGTALALSTAGVWPIHAFSVNLGSQVNSLRREFDGSLVLAGDIDYQSARTTVIKNPRTDKHPVIVARCLSAADVAKSIELAKHEQLVIALRSGGHSMMGWGTCDDGIVIDTSPLKQIEIDPVNRTARVGAGVLAAELVGATYAYGLAPVMSQCPTVGVAGLALGGGLGFLSGMYGATCDTLLQVELVSADGRIITCSQIKNSELFWALRGGGGNFGVATSFTFQLFPVGNVITGRLSYPVEEAKKILRFYADYMATAPDELQGYVSLSKTDGKGYLDLGLCWAGDLLYGEKVIAPFRQIVKPIEDTVRVDTFLAAFNFYHARSTNVVGGAMEGSYLQHLSEEAIDTVIERIAVAKGNFNPSIGLDHYMHGAVCRVPPKAMAFDLRQAGALHVWMPVDWSDPGAAQAAMAWVDGTRAALRPFSADRMYVNYPSSDQGKLAGAPYNQNSDRLRTMKRKYDPLNIFHINANIVPGDS